MLIPVKAKRDSESSLGADALKYHRDALRRSVQDLIEKAGGRQADVAENFGISQADVSRMANGMQWPRADTLILMRNLLGRSIDEILGLSLDEHIARAFHLARAAQVDDPVERARKLAPQASRKHREERVRKLAPEAPKRPSGKVTKASRSRFRGE
jgi:transcriptional regulator with XRE-family HTH domain